jgi:3-dehydrosphinganine reductase
LLQAKADPLQVPTPEIALADPAAAEIVALVLNNDSMKKGFFLKKNVLVTGGSSGIGLAIAKNLVSNGANIWILARRPDQLEIARQEIEGLRMDPNQIIEVISADVVDFDEIAQELENFCSKNGPPDILINSAGVALPGFVVDMPVDKYRWMMDINYFGTVQTTKTVLPYMLQRGSGIIVNISSFLGVLSIHGYSAYSSTKYAIRGFTDALRAEMHMRGIQVSIVFPDDTDTPQFAEEKKHRPEIVNAIWGDSPPMSPGKVAEDILNGVAKGHYMIVPGLKTRILFDLAFLVGRRIHRVINLLESFALRGMRSKKG